jgi:hypothetical protein
MSSDYEVAIVTSLYSSVVLVMWFFFRAPC